MKELRREITLWRGLVLAVSMVIGSGLFGLPGLTLEIGNVYAAASGWVVVSIAVVPLIFIFMRLGLRFASSAGLSRYAQEALGEWGGYGVSIVLCGTFILGIPALALIGASYIQALFGFPEYVTYLLAIGILAVMTVVNLYGVAVASVVNSLSFIALLTMVLFIISFNTAFFDKGGEVLLTAFSTGRFSYTEIWKACALFFWAYLGWENLSFGLEEFRDPQRTIPIVFWLSFLVVVVLYLSLAMVSIGAHVTGLRVEGAAGLAVLAERTPVSALVLLIIILVILSNANAWVFGASRLVFGAAREGILPRFLAQLSTRDVPRSSLLTLLIVYTLTVVTTFLVKGLTVSSLILVVSQNFIVLYLISIFAYWKSEKGLMRWVFSGLGLISCGFLLSGFTWWVLYPLGLLSVGYGVYRRRRVIHA